MSSSWTHEFTYPVHAPAGRIFDALTKPSELREWFSEHAEVEPQVGGAFRFWGRHTVGTPNAKDANGTITAYEPGKRLGFEWTVLGVPGHVAITLTPEETDEGPATKVAIKHDLSAQLDEPRPKELIDDWWRFTVGNLAAYTMERGEVIRPDFADPKPEIRLSMNVDAPREVVFRALTDPEALKKWMGAPAPIIEPRVGGRYELGWEYEVDGQTVKGGPMKILDIVPNERLVVSWPDWRGDNSVPMQSITWQLESHGASTRVTLVHSGFTRTVDFSDYPFGWGHFMSEMAKVALTLQR